MWIYPTLFVFGVTLSSSVLAEAPLPLPVANSSYHKCIEDHLSPNARPSQSKSVGDETDVGPLTHLQVRRVGPLLGLVCNVTAEFEMVIPFATYCCKLYTTYLALFTVHYWLKYVLTVSMFTASVN